LFSPVIIGALKGPDTLFVLIGYYIAQLKIEQAYRVLFVEDGATWIWNYQTNAVSEIMLGFLFRQKKEALSGVREIF
jgi:hypothetical protein